MFSIACCLVVWLGLRLGLDSAFGWLVVMHTYLYYFRLSLLHMATWFYAHFVTSLHPVTTHVPCRFGLRTDAPSYARSKRRNASSVTDGRLTAAGTSRPHHHRARSRSGKEPAHIQLYPVASTRGHGEHHRMKLACTRCTASQ